MTIRLNLWHYTCGHHHNVIKDGGGILKPAITLATPAQRKALRNNRVARFTSQVIWMTTIDDVVYFNAAAVGLQRQTNLPSRERHARRLECDRTGYRWQIADSQTQIEPWQYVRDYWPADVVSELEGVPGTKPETWWLTRGPIFAVYAPHRAEVSA